MSKAYEIIIGAYTKKEGHVDGKAQGISSSMIAEDGEMSEPKLIIEGPINPSFVTLSADGQFLYAVSETGPDVDSVGYVYAYHRDEEGNWKALNRQSTHAFAPCYVSVDPSGKILAVANYVGGVVCFYAIAADGSLAPAGSVIQLEGGSEHPRQDGSHPHAAVFDASGNYCYVPDLGSNRIWVLELGADAKDVTLLEELSAEIQPEAGPRHFVFHPDLPYAYLANELDNTICMFRTNKEDPGLALEQTISTLPEGFSEVSYVADIHLSPDGQHLYVSNRGHNSIAHFQLDQQNGKLKAQGHYSTAGDFPRNFAVHPNGQYLYAANQNSSNISWFSIETDGSLLPAGELKTGTPVCLQFRLMD